MRTRLMTTLMVVMASLLLVSAQALAQLPSFQSGQVLTAEQLNRIVEQVRRNTGAAGGSGGGATHTVACSSETIAAAMSEAQPGDTLRITGRCKESVVVDKDGITLDGGGSAVIDGTGFDAAVISVSGHQNVTIKGLTVQNGFVGIHMGLVAAALLEDVTVQGSQFKSGQEGLNDPSYGIGVHNSSMAAFVGTIVVRDNAGAGVIEAWNGGRIGLEAATVTGNDGHGIAVNTNSSSWLGTNRVADNGGDGIHVGHNSTVHIYDTDITGNSGHGIAAYNHAFVEAYQDAGSSITGNAGRGIEAWNGVSVDLWNATITGNTDGDVSASFGSRFRFEGGTVGTIFCDDSVLSSGEAVCPEPEQPEPEQ